MNACIAKRTSWALSRDSNHEMLVDWCARNKGSECCPSSTHRMSSDSNLKPCWTSAVSWNLQKTVFSFVFWQIFRHFSATVRLYVSGSFSMIPSQLCSKYQLLYMKHSKNKLSWKNLCNFRKKTYSKQNNLKIMDHREGQIGNIA